MRLLITGANGFVGGALCTQAVSRGFDVRAATRHCCSFLGDDRIFPVGPINANTNWHDPLEACDAVVHCAAHVHVSGNTKGACPEIFREINVAGTLNLANQAAHAGVRRFVFISSIGVNGAETFDKPFTADDIPSPHSYYAKSKYEAEIGLKAFAAKKNMELVIIRPPLVYGPDAPGNFGVLLRLLKSELPLPLGKIQNLRSYVALDNLIDLVLNCVIHPAAADQTFLVSDNEDLSTTEFLLRIGRALNKPTKLYQAPTGLLRRAGALLGMASLSQSLLGSLQVDIRKNYEILGWSPPVSLDEGLYKAVSKQL